MSHDALKNLNASDQEQLGKLALHYGFASLACYQLLGRNLTLISSTISDNKQWPPTATFSSDYTPTSSREVPIGWIKPNFSPENRKRWPRSVSFYFPAQCWSATNLIFAVQNATGRRTVVGSLDGALEALTAKFCATIDHNENRHLITESDHLEQMEKVSVDIKMMINHELRNPLTSIMGYSELISSIAEQNPEQQEIKEHIDVIIKESQRALLAVGKVATLYDMHWEPLNTKEMVEIDLGILSDKVYDEVKLNVSDWVSHIAKNSDLKLSLRKPDDNSLKALGHESMLKKAVLEVVKNGVMYADHDRVNVTLYRSENMAVIDVEDDGPGVTQGFEEMIFIRFFQEPFNIKRKKIKRGLGYGLHLARNAVELHGGTLRYIRGVGKNGVFRFLIPLVDKNQKTLERTIDES